MGPGPHPDPDHWYNQCPEMLPKVEQNEDEFKKPEDDDSENWRQWECHLDNIYRNANWFHKLYRYFSNYL